MSVASHAKKQITLKHPKVSITKNVGFARIGAHAQEPF